MVKEYIRGKKFWFEKKGEIEKVKVKKFFFRLEKELN
jgi:hypothetical protein